MAEIEVQKTLDQEALEKINAYQPVKNMIKKLSTKRPYIIKANKPKYQVVCLDLGCKNNVIQELNNRKCSVVVLPYNTDPAKILSYKPNAVFVTCENGQINNILTPKE